MKRLLSILVLTTFFAPSAFATIPNHIWCREHRSETLLFFTFDIRDTESGTSYVDLGLDIMTRDVTDSRSASSMGSHDAQNPNRFNLADGGFISYDPSSEQVTFQWKTIGQESVRVLELCSL